MKKAAQLSTITPSANATSVYTAAQIFSMLPEKLSTDLTSLGEGAGDERAIVIELTS